MTQTHTQHVSNKTNLILHREKNQRKLLSFLRKIQKDVFLALFICALVFSIKELVIHSAGFEITANFTWNLMLVMFMEILSLLFRRNEIIRILDVSLVIWSSKGKTDPFLSFICGKVYNISGNCLYNVSFFFQFNHLASFNSPHHQCVLNHIEWIFMHIFFMLIGLLHISRSASTSFVVSMPLFLGLCRCR